MSPRTRLKIRKVEMFLKKDVFSGRYLVRNIMILIVLSICIGTVGATIISLKEKNSKYRKTDNDNQMIGTTTNNDIIVVKDFSLSNQVIHELKVELENESLLVASATRNNILAATEIELEKFISTDYCVNVRKEPIKEAEVLIQLAKGDEGTVIEKQDLWTKISFNGVEGYVYNEFVLFGEEANKFKNDILFGKEDSEEDKIIAQDEAEEPAAQPATQPAAQPAAQPATQPAAQPATQPAAQPATQPATQPAAQPATQPAAQPAEAESNNNEIQPTTVNRGTISLSDEDIKLIACVVTLEAGGESYEGQLAVANVILNRYLSGRWGSVYDVLYAPSQFTVVTSPKMQTTIDNGPGSTALLATNDAVSGKNNIGSFTCFKPKKNVNTGSMSSYTIIGNHCFY